MRYTLVHGGLHGAWCWERVIPELEALGHEAVAVELPGHGALRAERSTLAGYRDAVLEVLRPGDVLVGHSTGCPVATLAADSVPEISHIVYLAGPLPIEGKPLAYDSGGGREDDGTVTTMSDFDDGADKYLRVSDDGQFFVVDYDGAFACFFHDCDADTAAWAFERLTPQCIDVMVTEPLSVPRFWNADIPRSFIRCAEDRAFPAALSERQIRRLGVKPLDIESSHSPFLSRPAELARLLVHAPDTRPIGPLDPGV